MSKKSAGGEDGTRDAERLDALISAALSMGEDPPAAAALPPIARNASSAGPECGEEQAP